MESPDSKTTNINNKTSDKLIKPSSSDSNAFQDSPIFNYISNLSPIQPVKVAPVAQGFPGLASPPLIFTSPRINSQTIFLNRKLQSSASNLEFSQDNDKFQKNGGDPKDSGRLAIESHCTFISSDGKGCGNKQLEQVANFSSSGCLDEFLANPEECGDSSREKQSDDVPQSSHRCLLEKEDNGEHVDIDLDGSTMPKVRERAQTKSRINIKLVKNELQQLSSTYSECSGILPKFSTDRTSEPCQAGDSFHEASHLERGTLRRCLFDENQMKYSTDGSGSCSPNVDLTKTQELANMSTETSGHRQTINLFKPITDICVSQMNYPVAITKPLGIGLHLNSVVYPRSMDSAIGNQQLSEKMMRVKEENSVFVTSNQSVGKVNVSSMSSNSIGEFPASSEEMHHNEAYPVATSGKALSSDDVENSNNPIILKPGFSTTIRHDKRKFTSELAESNEEYNLASINKKRKKASSTTDDGTSKRCNCKKTKCLKLYCDCFAAGFYCGESCACQGCFNRPEYEDTVLETRQQIESRNPLAFAPKIVQKDTNSPATSKEVQNVSTPSSARHKRGCNCKKSMCLKKYCECYQAGVGCSDGCRCEGCKNIYGKREDYNSFAREVMIKKAAGEKSEGLLDEEQEMSTVGCNFVKSRLHNSPKMTPVTPALQYSDQRKNMLKSQLPLRRSSQSLDSHHHILPSDENFRTSARNSMNLGPLDSEKACENSEDRLSFICDEPMHASRSTPSAKTSDSRNDSQPESFSSSGLPPPSSLRWRSSPITPITHFFDSGSKYCSILEDDTPEILKDSSTPTKSVKVSSPNKKRISPPHTHINVSESLKSSRKFLLRAVPTFPPLTPLSKNTDSGRKS